MPRPHTAPLPLVVLVLGVALSSGGCSAVSTATGTTAGYTPAPTATKASRVVPRGQSADRVASLIEHVADGSGGLTRLGPDYMVQRLLDREDSAEISAAFDRLSVADVPAVRAALIRALELDFVHDPDTSSLDLLNPELSEHFRGFDWHEHDYPGGPEGPDEQFADVLTDAMDLISPERRANRGRAAILLRDEMTPELWAYALGQWAAVPGEPDHKLNRYAAASYVQMRVAAGADGVDLSILSAHRDPVRAANNAAQAANGFAVASFSSHSLGLAIDVALPRAGPVASGAAETPSNRFRLTTEPMSAVVAMRCSPTHKWLHLHGHAFGWYPFQHEPWHWEYNPPGFRRVFFGEFPAGTPQRQPGEGA